MCEWKQSVIRMSFQFKREMSREGGREKEGERERERETERETEIEREFPSAVLYACGRCCLFCIITTVGRGS